LHICDCRILALRFALCPMRHAKRGNLLIFFMQDYSGEGAAVKINFDTPAVIPTQIMSGPIFKINFDAPIQIESYSLVDADFSVDGLGWLFCFSDFPLSLSLILDDFFT
jgi:hypothetical protein